MSTKNSADTSFRDLVARLNAMNNQTPEQERAALMEAAGQAPKVLDDKEVTLSDIAKLAGIKEYVEPVKVSPKAKKMVESITAPQRSITKAIYHLSIEYNFLINDSNYGFFKNVTIIIFIIYSLLLIFLGFLRPQKFEISLNDQLSNYFIAGSSIYIGTFIFGSNFDYRLIFLILTIPYIININNFHLKFLLIISITISINSFLFQHSEHLFLSEINHWIYYTKAAFVYLCKFLILSFLCFLLGSNLKKINFLSLNDKK